jgi:hypothetical protein
MAVSADRRPILSMIAGSALWTVLTCAFAAIWAVRPI